MLLPRLQYPTTPSPTPTNMAFMNISLCTLDEITIRFYSIFTIQFVFSPYRAMPTLSNSRNIFKWIASNNFPSYILYIFIIIKKIHSYSTSQQYVCVCVFNVIISKGKWCASLNLHFS